VSEKVPERIVVSGATGFLGGHLCAHLVAQGFDVLGLGRDASKGAALSCAFEAVDLAETPSLTTLQTADVFVHAAALSSAWGPRVAFERANVTGTRHALAMAHKLGVRRFVFISSPSVYFRFRDQLHLSEDTLLPKPVNAYAATKVAAETLVRASGLDAIILRPRGLYGPGDTALLPRLIRAAARPIPLPRGGKAVTDLTFVADVVRAIVAAMTAPPDCAGRTYNISGGEALAIGDIITAAAQAAGIRARFTPMPAVVVLASARLAEGVARLTPGQPEPVITAYGAGILAYSQTLDISRAGDELGFVPEVRFADGLKRTFAA